MHRIDMIRRSGLYEIAGQDGPTHASCPVYVFHLFSSYLVSRKHACHTYVRTCMLAKMRAGRYSRKRRGIRWRRSNLRTRERAGSSAESGICGTEEGAKLWKYRVGSFDHPGLPKVEKKSSRTFCAGARVRVPAGTVTCVCARECVYM